MLAQVYLKPGLVSNYTTCHPELDSGSINYNKYRIKFGMIDLMRNMLTYLHYYYSKTLYATQPAHIINILKIYSVRKSPRPTDLGFTRISCLIGLTDSAVSENHVCRPGMSGTSHFIITPLRFV